MEGKIENTDKKETPSKTGEELHTYFWWFFALFLLAMSVAVYFFCKNRCYTGDDWILDNSAVGNYGDLIGGVIGSLVALYSAYLLVNTLHDQKQVNKNAIDTNEKMLTGNRVAIQQTYRQIFESRFMSLYTMYQNAVASYKVDEEHGRDALDELMQGFSNRTFSGKSHYTVRNSTAMKKFEDFYAQHSRYTSVHMRTLYLLMKTIGEQECIDEYGNTIFDEIDRVNYSKCVRAQLSEGEMILIRYNCLTSRGVNFRTFVNQFNLIKHLPILSLLEFKKYRELLKDDEISAVNTMLISLKKNILEHVTSRGYCEPLVLSPKYKVEISLENQNKELKMTVTCDNARPHPGNLGYPLIERSLNALGRELRDNLFFDFLKESLVFANFKIYNHSDEMTFAVPENKDNGDLEITEFQVEKTTPLIFAAWQMEMPT